MERDLNSGDKNRFNIHGKNTTERINSLSYDLKEQAESIGAARLCIPFEYLTSTQEAIEFSSNRGKRAEKAIKNGGLPYLLQDPIIVVAVFNSDRKHIFQGINDLSLFIEDGHHRTNKAIKHSKDLGITFMPSLVLTVEQLSIIQKNLNRNPSNPDDIVRLLQTQSISARDSLERRRVKRFGKDIIGVNNIKELSELFTTF